MTTVKTSHSHGSPIYFVWWSDSEPGAGLRTRAFSSHLDLICRVQSFFFLASRINSNGLIRIPRSHAIVLLHNRRCGPCASEANRATAISDPFPLPSFAPRSVSSFPRRARRERCGVFREEREDMAAHEDAPAIWYVVMWNVGSSL